MSDHVTLMLPNLSSNWLAFIHSLFTKTLFLLACLLYSGDTKIKHIYLHQPFHLGLVSYIQALLQVFLKCQLLSSFFFFLFQILFSFRLPYNIQQRSLCYAVGPCWYWLIPAYPSSLGLDWGKSPYFSYEAEPPEFAILWLTAQTCILRLRARSEKGSVFIPSSVSRTS